MLCSVRPPIDRWASEGELHHYKFGIDLDSVRDVFTLVKDDMVAHYLSNHTRLASIIPPIDTLHIALYYLRNYPSIRSMSAELQIPKTTLSEQIEHTLRCMFDRLVPVYVPPHAAAPRTIIDSRLINARIAVDSTFIAIPHTENEDMKHEYYHKKSPTKYACKLQIATDKHGAIWHMSSVVPGAVADISLFRDSGLQSKLKDTFRAIGDKGYQGAQYTYTPHKGTQLNLVQERHNAWVASARAIVENVNARIKQWRILSDAYRESARDLDRVTRVAHVVCALHNMIIVTRPMRR